jgi:hypothetical protein
MAVRFSGCIRSHGLTDFPDPTVGSNGLPNWSGVSNQAPGYRRAKQACKKDLPSLGPHTPAEKATAKHAALEYSTCMRSNGVPNFPDPNGQGLIQINATSTLEPSSPAFQTAQTACQNLDKGFGVSIASASSTPGGAGSGS